MSREAAVVLGGITGGSFVGASDMSSSFSGRSKKKFSFSNVTTAQEYSNFLMSGLNIASTGQIGDVNARGINIKMRSGGSGKATRKATSRLQASVQGPVEGQQTRDLGAAGRQLVGVNNEQVALLTNLYEQRLNDVLTRRSRPGFRQVQ